MKTGRRTKAALALLLFGGATVTPSSARGAPTSSPPDKATCNAAYEQGQRLRKTGDLRAAREKFLLCARDPCPKIFQPECVQWLSDVESALPSVVFVVTSESGATIGDVRVSIDGALVASHLDGSAIDVDPGEHVFRFEIEGHEPVEKKLLVVQGDKGRRIDVSFGAEAPHANETSDVVPSSTSPTPWGAIALFGVGAVAFASFGAFGLHGLSQRSDLDKCTPHCNQDDIDATRRSFLIADVSLGVGVVAAALGTVLLVTAHRSSSATTTSVGFSPMRSGAGFSLFVTYD